MAPPNHFIDMEHDFFEKPDDLKRAFEVEKAPELSDYKPLANRKVAFSVHREYLDNIRYIPPRNKDGNPDTLALLEIIYEHPDESGKVETKVRILLKASRYSHYLNGHFEYDFRDPNCPTIESVDQSRRTPRPIALSLVDEFFYDQLIRGTPYLIIDTNNYPEICSCLWQE